MTHKISATMLALLLAGCAASVRPTVVDPAAPATPDLSAPDHRGCERLQTTDSTGDGLADQRIVQRFDDDGNLTFREDLDRLTGAHFTRNAVWVDGCNELVEDRYSDGSSAAFFRTVERTCDARAEVQLKLVHDWWEVDGEVVEGPWATETTTDVVYDALDRKIEKTVFATADGVNRTVVTTWRYDADGRVDRIEQHANGLPERLVETTWRDDGTWSDQRIVQDGVSTLETQRFDGHARLLEYTSVSPDARQRLALAWEADRYAPVRQELEVDGVPTQVIDFDCDRDDPTFCEMFGDGRALFTSEESTVLVVDGLYDWSGFMSVSCDAVDAQGRARVPNAVFPPLDPLAPFPGRTLGLSRFGL